MGVVVGDTIQIKQGQGLSKINTRYKVLNIDPILNVYGVVPRRQQVYGTYSANSARAAKVLYTYPTITDLVAVNVTSRKTGRPSYLPRGSRRVQRT